MNYEIKAMDEKVFGFIYGCAMRDAILQRAYEGGKKDWIVEVGEARSLVREYADRVLAGEFKEDLPSVREAHDAAFLDTAIKVADAINNKPEGSNGVFAAGNAQKLINIAVKHLYAHTYSLHLLGAPSIREHFRFCHCPMDSIMLSIVWGKYGDLFGSKKREAELGKSTEFMKSWGKEDFEVKDGVKSLPRRYICYQRSIAAIVEMEGTQLFPIEFDYVEWRRIRSVRRNKEPALAQ